MSRTALLNQTGELRLYAGETATGPTWAAPVTVRCRIEDGNQLVRTSGGAEVVSSARVFLAPGLEVSPESLFNDRTILTVEKVHGARALHHLELSLK